MPPISFIDKLEARVAAIDSLLCVGLDPHDSELVLDAESTAASSAEQKCQAALAFCQRLVTATLPYAACYKPNAAFFEALGDGGAAVLRSVCTTMIPSDVPILLDVKRGDIGTTAAAYAEACYEHWGADAVTLSPLMGWDSVSPFVTGT
jgi:orotidine 5'-phosphate decarboxylase subfamily 2